MIKATELRLENLIYYRGEAYAMQSMAVSRMDWKFECVILGMKHSDLQYVNFEEMEAIPLTEEWLERVGFMKYKRDVNYILSDENHPLDFADIEDWSIYEIRELWFFVGVREGRCCHVKEGANYDETIGVHKVGGYFKYVHQLQNLFYCLTGQELTIKETV